MRPPISTLLALGLLSLSACDKLKGAMGKDDDGGAAPASAGGGGGGGVSGALSFLGGDFEGELTIVTTSKKQPARGGPQQMVFGIKKPKYRIEASGGAPGGNPALAQSGTFIIDLPAKKGYALNHPQKTAVVLDFDKMKQMSPPGTPGGTPGTPSTPPTIEKTGKKETIAGYTCEIWNVTSEGKKTEICAAEGLTWIDLGDLGWSSPEVTVAAVATEANRFPLRMITFDAAGAEDTRMETTKVEKKALDAASFEVPPGYRVIDMAAMMRGFGVPGGMPGMPSGIPHFAPPPKTR
jgi:hypothetical protein